MTEIVKIPNREELIEDLQNKLLKVTFTKKNGDERLMVCTLSNLLTKHTNQIMKEAIPKNEEVLPVWDVENNAWRSFRLDSVIKVENLGPIPKMPDHMKPGYKALKFIEEGE
jgi:hypothetical protein